MFGSLYFILIKYQLAVKLAMLELMCVRECACECVCARASVCVCARASVCACMRVCASACVRRDHFNCFLIPAESTLNTCLINNHCIKVCFYL